MSELTRLDFLAASGDMGERIRRFDWAKTPLGPMESWSPALKTMLRIMLANRFPHILWWGPHYIQFYNDPYRPIPGAKHPEKALGQPASECWSEIRHIIGPLIDRPFNGGAATWDDDILLEINRHGFVEESHFTIAYSPVPDETVPGGIGGVLATVHEITGKIVGDRRVLGLRDLGVRSAEARTAEDACDMAALTLAAYSQDIPFALLYLIDADRKHARPAGAAGVEPGGAASPAVLALEGDEAENAVWPLARVLRSEASITLPDLTERLQGRVPPGPWTDPPHTAVIVPIRSNKAHHLAGFLVAGISARLHLDDAYRDFLNLVASQIATAIASAREYEEEKRRAEALAEIDRAKTAFFSNVSHEFRTPLTLMLGPIEELLSRSHTELPPFAKGQLEISHRNSLRLLRLVNSLLDFTRIEAGRVQAIYEPTDLAAFTAELASVFRAATERAGLRLSVDCPTLPEPVYVDRDMWEKIILNLLSNAFKFTFEGGIAVTLRAVDSGVELRVADTGVGIPAEAMPRLFERFHRIPNARSRTHEGSGIGLALVQELVKLHGGSVRAESRLGEGSTFIVAIPFGKDHLPAEYLGGGRTPASSAIGPAPFVEEALRWLPDEVTLDEPERLPRQELLAVPCPADACDETRPLVLVADDNADMRQYLSRLLAERYRVQTAPDGRAALDAARDQVPDLVLSDVMMPRLDGLGLVRELRADPELATLPIILLSARAGEECRVEGLQHGADDYLIKPFSARELLARVAAHLEMARMRKDAAEEIRRSEERFRAFVTASSDVMYRMSPDWNEMLQLQGRDFIPDTTSPSSTWLAKYIHPDDQPLVLAAINEAVRTRSVFELEHRVLRVDGALGWTFSRAIPVMNGSGEIVEWFGAAADITERKRAEEELRRTKEGLEIRVRERTAELQVSNMALVDHAARLERLNEELQEFAFVASHDLQEPLRKIQTFGNLLAGKYRELLDEEGRDYLMRMTRAASRMSELLHSLLAYSRIATRPNPFEPVQLGRVVEEALSDLEMAVTGNGGRVEAGDLPTIDGDAPQLRQLFQNLIGNAIKYCKESEKPLVRIHGNVDGEVCRILIRDNGIGFEQEYVDRIFRPFQRLHGKSSNYEGMGMGLAICRKIVERHGGSITAESASGHGATFIVTLPVRNKKTRDNTA